MSETNEALLSAITEELSKQETSADEMARLLEAKLALERAAWKRSHAQAQIIRAASFVFLLLIVFGALIAFYFASQRAGENGPPASPVPAHSN